MWLSTLGPAQAGGSGSKRAEAALATPPTFQQVEEIVIGRCSMCHAAEPVWLGIARAPRGVKLDTPERIAAHAREIVVSAAWSSAMPPSNVTAMTEEERATLAAWWRSERATR